MGCEKKHKSSRAPRYPAYPGENQLGGFRRLQCVVSVVFRLKPSIGFCGVLPRQKDGT